MPVLNLADSLMPRTRMTVTARTMSTAGTLSIAPVASNFCRLSFHTTGALVHAVGRVTPALSLRKATT